MGNIVGCCAAGVGWCCCSAAGSLLSSCCGSDKASNVAPSPQSGRKRSIFLIFLSIVCAFAFQYALGPGIKPSQQTSVNPVIRHIADSWMSGCEEYIVDDDIDSTERQICSGNSGVYRAAGSALIFYVLAAVAAYFKPTANREAWPAKFILFFALVIATVFIPNDPLFTPGLLWVFRVGAILFMLFNQLVVLDLSYNLNEAWVAKADKAELDEGEGKGKKWLGALLFACAVFFIGSLVAIGVMYAYFTGCATNNAFITITLVMGLINTIVQLTGEEASLFTSTCIFAYSTYLLYSAVSKNPDGSCNPRLGDESTGNIVLGVVITFISIMWLGFSHTAHRTVGEESDEMSLCSHDKDESDKAQNIVSGIVLNTQNDEEKEFEKSESLEGNVDPKDEAHTKTFSTSWKLNIILAFITCFYAVSLTSWGSISSGGNIANPSGGKTNMWIIIASQWLMMLLYLWTLVAPKLFPEREFS